VSAPREIQLDTRQGRLAGLSWRLEGAPRVLCLHGWLDNAASFEPLAPLLDRLDLVAVDLPGHGHSEHRHATTRYHFIDYLFNLDAALDALGWKDCHLLGHSLGAAVSSVYAAGAPERVRSIVLLDAMGPVSVTAEGTARRLRRSLFKNRRGAGRTRQFDSIDEMITARRAASGIPEAAARLICERAARQSGSKFEWRSDPALNWISSLVMTDDQALDLVSHIEAPALTLHTEGTSSLRDTTIFTWTHRARSPKLSRISSSKTITLQRRTHHETGEHITDQSQHSGARAPDFRTGCSGPGPGPATGRYAG
jgi:pimeloyl-ACP methyl ester carboxylesterase